MLNTQGAELRYEAYATWHPDDDAGGWKEGKEGFQVALVHVNRRGEEHEIAFRCSEMRITEDLHTTAIAAWARLAVGVNREAITIDGLQTANHPGS